MDHVQATLINACAQITAEAVLSQDSFEEILKRNLISGVSMVVGSYGASHIGQAYKIDELSSFEHKLSHGALGALAGFIEKGDLDGSFAGAIGAVTGEIAAEEYKAYRESAHKADGGDPPELTERDSKVYRDMVEKGVAIAKMTAATLLGEDPNIAAMTAGNAARHNAFQFIIPTFFIGLSAWDVYQAYKKGGFEAGLKQVGVEVAISVAGGKAAKAGIEVGKNFIRLAKSLSLSSKPLVRGKPMLSRAPICKS